MLSESCYRILKFYLMEFCTDCLPACLPARLPACLRACLPACLMPSD